MRQCGREGEEMLGVMTKAVRTPHRTTRTAAEALPCLVHSATPCTCVQTWNRLSAPYRIAQISPAHINGRHVSAQTASEHKICAHCSVGSLFSVGTASTILCEQIWRWRIMESRGVINGAVWYTQYIFQCLNNNTFVFSALFILFKMQIKWSPVKELITFCYNQFFIKLTLGIKKHVWMKMSLRQRSNV